MKSRFAALLLAGIMTLSLVACGQQPAENTASDASENKNTESTENVTISSTQQTTETNGSSSKKVLVAYFTAAENSDVDAVSSASVVTVGGTAKGRVQALAEMIQAETGGDLFSIRTSTVYPGDGGKLIDFAAEEQNANARPVLTTHIENLDDYDVIFVGYPNWRQGIPTLAQNLRILFRSTVLGIRGAPLGMLGALDSSFSFAVKRASRFCAAVG